MECRLCGNDKLRFRFIVKGYRLFTCENCSFIQVVDKPNKEQLDEIYSINYFSHNKYSDLYTLNKENNRRLNLITEFLQNNKAKLLDYGCATGDFIEFVSKSEKDFKIWGLDYSQYAIEEARKKNPEIKSRLSIGTIETNNFKNDFFDCIMLWDVIEHVWNPLFVLNKLFRFLKPGGYIFISTPNIGANLAKILGKYWAFMTPPEHLSFFTIKSLKYLVEIKLNGEIVKWESKGKWINIGFFFYKIKRIFPKLIPRCIIRFFEFKFTRKLSLYFSSGDIQYLVIQKKL